MSDTGKEVFLLTVRNGKGESREEKREDDEGKASDEAEDK